MYSLTEGDEYSYNWLECKRLLLADIPVRRYDEPHPLFCPFAAEAETRPSTVRFTDITGDDEHNYLPKAQVQCDRPHLP